MDRFQRALQRILPPLDSTISHLLRTEPLVMDDNCLPSFGPCDLSPSSDFVEDVCTNNDTQSVCLSERLLEATNQGNEGEIRDCLERGADVNTQDADGRTPLYLATANNSVSIVCLLLQYGADTNVASEYGHARAKDTGSYYRLAQLEWLPIHVACHHGNTAALQVLLQAYQAVGDGEHEMDQVMPEGAVGGQKVDGPVPAVDKQDLDGATPLILAAYQGSTQNIKMLTDAGCDLNQRNNEGRTALMEAIVTGHRDIAQHLIACGSFVNVMDNHGYQALSDAVSIPDRHSVAMLLAAGADTNAQDSRGRTSLHISVLYGHNDIVSMLLDHKQCLLNIQDEDGFTPLMLAAWDPWSRNTLPSLQRLILEGAELDIADGKGASPVFKAWPHRDHILLLLQHGASVANKYEQSSTLGLLELAALQSDWYLVEALLCSGYKPRQIDFAARRDKQKAHAYKVLKEYCQVPLSLKDSCRLAIRQCVSKQDMYSAVQQLPLPALIRNYLRMVDLASVKMADVSSSDSTSYSDSDISTSFSSGSISSMDL